MRGKRSRRVLAWLAATSAGTLWLGGCVTDTQLRDFSQTTVIRIFWQSIGTAIQSAIVDQFGARSEG